MHSIINQKSYQEHKTAMEIESRRVHTEGIEISVNCPQFDFNIYRALTPFPVLCLGYRANKIDKDSALAELTFPWANEQSRSCQ